MASSHEPLKRGYDVDENAIRFSNYFHVAARARPPELRLAAARAAARSASTRSATISTTTRAA